MGCKHGKGYTRCFMFSKYGRKAFHQKPTKPGQRKDEYGYNLKRAYLIREKSYQMHHHPENVYRVRALTEAINFGG